MSYLIANVPAIDCFVRKEFLYAEQDHIGELTPCYLTSVKSIKGRALTFEAFLTDYGALYDKLPIHAFVWKEEIGVENMLPLNYLQVWDSFSYYITVLEKQMLKGLQCAVFMKDKKLYEGEYLFTIDSCHSDSNELNCTLSETATEHKSFNIIKLKNGQFAAQPNNRIRWYDQSLVPIETEKPDFHYMTKIYSVEDSQKWSVGHTNKWAYKSKQEEEK